MVHMYSTTNRLSYLPLSHRNFTLVWMYFSLNNDDEEEEKKKARVGVSSHDIE